MPSPTPLPQVAQNAARLILALLAEQQTQAAEARWPTATRDLASIHTGEHTDPTHRTATHPDPTNTARANELEQLIRRIERELQDAANRPNRNRIRARGKPCTTHGCDRTARRRGLCDACYMRSYRAIRTTS